MPNQPTLFHRALCERAVSVVTKYHLIPKSKGERARGVVTLVPRESLSQVFGLFARFWRVSSRMMCIGFK